MKSDHQVRGEVEVVPEEHFPFSTKYHHLNLVNVQKMLHLFLYHQLRKNAFLEQRLFYSLEV